MDKLFEAEVQIGKMLQEARNPVIVSWNRMETRPRTDDFSKALRAEIRDPLWMLGKQWQMGEFIADDAGSPAFAKILTQDRKLSRYQAGDHPVQNYEENVPFEAKVEQKAIPFQAGNRPLFLNIRLQMGRQWLKLIKSVGNFRKHYIQQYPFDLPNPENQDWIGAHEEVWQQFAAVAGRCMDGFRFYQYLLEAEEHRAYDGLQLDDESKIRLDELAQHFITWYQELYYQPFNPKNDAWNPDRLEYQFAFSAPIDSETEEVFRAEEYYHGHLDWYNVDIDKSETSLGNDPRTTPNELISELTQVFIPTPVKFAGMPDTRWWAFEDQRISFPDIKADLTDLHKLVLIEFGLVYANDWFLFPLRVPVGSISKIKGLAITNVFGERHWIEAAGKGLDDDWQRWNMFTNNIIGNTGENADLSLAVLPTTLKIQEGPPIEEVNLVRDELSNMVWGIETKVLLPDGSTGQGSEAAGELREYFEKKVEAITGNQSSEPKIYKADTRYQLMNTVPENWIPFIPVHTAKSDRQIQLQRAAMPRLIEGDPEAPKKIRPRTQLLREGLDEKAPYFIFEEEVPRAGVKVRQSFQRTRGQNGKVFTWLGVHKTTGKGEGMSNLAFDQLIDVNQQDQPN